MKNIKKNHEGDCVDFGNYKYAESYSKLASDRIIFFNEPFTKKAAADLTALLLYYDNINNKDIIIYINSSGGDADGLIQIYDVINLIKSDVSTICLGKAYSAGGIILAAGTKGKRKCYANSEIMLHGIQFSFPILGDTSNASKDYYEYITYSNNLVMKILSNHIGISLEKITKDCARDMYFNAEEAKKYGIIDTII
jgi:ATP-dependent Clp protease, protease subunit